MFRLYLKKKLLDGLIAPEQIENTANHKPKRRNRRVKNRIALNSSQLKILNEKDIFIVREISTSGFSSHVSNDTVKRFSPGDTYEAKFQYLSQIFELNTKVAWMRGKQIGFEIINTSKKTQDFLNRIMKPVEIADSLQKIESNFTNSNEQGKTWYHGEYDSDLYTWHDPEGGSLNAWQLSIGDDYIEWSENGGMKSGKTEQYDIVSSKVSAIPSRPLANVKDLKVDKHKKQLATDIIMALSYPVREEILNTIMG
jgi:hypoxanthine phosphoribosyltransferase